MYGEPRCTESHDVGLIQSTKAPKTWPQGFAPSHQRGSHAQGYLAHKKPLSLRTLQWDHAWAPLAVLGRGHFLMSEAAMHTGIFALTAQALCEAPSHEGQNAFPVRCSYLLGYLAHKKTPPHRTLQ